MLSFGNFLHSDHLDKVKHSKHMAQHSKYTTARLSWRSKYSLITPTLIYAEAYNEPISDQIHNSSLLVRSPYSIHWLGFSMFKSTIRAVQSDTRLDLTKLPAVSYFV